MDLFAIGQELGDDPVDGPLALAVYKRAFRMERATIYLGTSFGGDVERNLAAVFARAGKAAELRTFALRSVSYFNPFSSAAAGAAYTVSRRPIA